MEEQRGISSGFVSEPISDSGTSSEKRKGNGLEEEKDDESGSKRVKVQDLDSDAKSSNLQSDGNIGIVQKPNLSSEQMSEMLVAPKELVAKDMKSSTVLETTIDLPKADSISTNDALLESHTVKDDGNFEPRGGGGGDVDGVLKNSSLLKQKEISESVGSPRGAAESDLIRRDPSQSILFGEKVGTFQVSSAAGSLGKSDSMRRWMEMKKNGFVSGPLGGVAAPTPSTTVPSTPVEVPAQKQPKVNKRRGDSLKKRNEVPKKEQQQVDRFSNVTAPSGLLTELNPGIINRVRTRKQVCSIIEALIGNANDDATVGERRHNLNVRESVREGRALAFKLPSTGVSANANSITSPEQAAALVEAATVASQWLEFLHQDLNGRLSAVQDSRKRVQNILTTELPLLFSSRESSSNKESTLEMTNMNTSCDASSDKTVTETHQIRWSAKFDQLNKALCEEERDLECSLKQVKEMQSRCNDGLKQMGEYSPFSSQSSDSSFGNNGSQGTNMAVHAAAASIFSTCSYLLSMMKPPPTGS